MGSSPISGMFCFCERDFVDDILQRVRAGSRRAIFVGIAPSRTKVAEPPLEASGGRPFPQICASLDDAPRPRPRPAFGGNQPSESPLVLMLACFFVCRGQEKACGGICMRFMLCLLNLKWQDFLALLEVGAAVGVHPVHGLVQLRSANASVNSTLLDPLLHFPTPATAASGPSRCRSSRRSSSAATRRSRRRRPAAPSARRSRRGWARRSGRRAPRAARARADAAAAAVAAAAGAAAAAAARRRRAERRHRRHARHARHARHGQAPARRRRRARRGAARRRGGCTGAGEAALRRRGRAGGWGRRRGAPTSRC